MFDIKFGDRLKYYVNSNQNFKSRLKLDRPQIKKSSARGALWVNTSWRPNIEQT